MRPLSLEAPGSTARRLLGIAAIVALLAGCAGTPPTAPAAATGHGPSASDEASPAFTVSGAVLKRARFDLAELRAMPATTLTVGADTYTGVSLWSLLNDPAVGLQADARVRNPLLSMYVVAIGSDGYRAVVSLGEMSPEFGNRTALLAYARNGTPLGRNGAARLVVAGDHKPGRSVARLAAIEVFAAQPSGR